MRAARWTILLALIALASAYAIRRFASADRERSDTTVSERIAQYGTAVDGRLMPVFAARGLPYPPTRLALIGFKAERVMEVWATNRDSQYQFVKTYRIVGASGKAGPKLRRGDRQVPEGIYRIELLNPNSSSHLALRVNYPNEFDRLQAQREGRTELGGDIMIHGGWRSSGCLAVGNEAAEDLFVLAARVGIENIVVILCPVNLRQRDVRQPENQPAWIQELYGDLRQALKSFPESEVSRS